MVVLQTSSMVRPKKFDTKKSSDIDTRPFYLMIIFPKDNEKVTVQKGMFIFQMLGSLVSKLLRQL